MRIGSLGISQLGGKYNGKILSLKNSKKGLLNSVIDLKVDKRKEESMKIWIQIISKVRIMIKGFVLVLIGIIWLWYTLKYKNEGPSVIAENWRGITISAILILLGLVYIIRSCYF